MSLAAEKTFVDRISKLPPLPAIAQQILAVTGSSDSSGSDVARVLRGDPAIAAKVLQVANSPFYGASQEISQLSRAATRLGVTAVQSLVLGMCARRTMSANTLHRSEHETLWHHATAVAAVCELIARRARFRPVEEAFVAGLLHDTGQLAMLTLQPGQGWSVT